MLPAFMLSALMAAITVQAAPSPGLDTWFEFPNSPPTASGCNYYSSPSCCISALCKCANGWFYEINQDNVKKGKHGCDPPWGIKAKSRNELPGVCCK